MADYTPMTAEERDAFVESLTKLDLVDEATGEWTYDLNARTTGFTLTVRFNKETTPELAAGLFKQMNGARDSLGPLVNRLLDADAACAALLTR